MSKDNWRNSVAKNIGCVVHIVDVEENDPSPWLK